MPAFHGFKPFKSLKQNKIRMSHRRDAETQIRKLTLSRLKFQKCIHDVRVPVMVSSLLNDLNDWNVLNDLNARNAVLFASLW